MFTLEAMLSARLNHPNIVQVFEFAEVEGERYLAMEYVHGINVGDLLKQLKDVPVPIGMAAHIVREVSLALGYAHALTDDDGHPLSLIHRDISPSNVMIGYDGSVKIVDFGVAKALTQSDERTRTGSLKGKVAYMSPEAVDGEVELDRRTDVFAAGVVLFELLTGKRLFKGHDDLRTIALVRACKIDPPSTLRPEIPGELDLIVGRALARDRDQRYQSADELAASLTKVAHEHVWDAYRTAAFLKQNDIQPGSEPELRARPPLVAPAPEPAEPAESAATLQVTVVERKGARSSSSLPVIAVSRPRLTWALVGAGAALVLVAGALFGFRRWTDTSSPHVLPAPEAGSAASVAAAGGPSPIPAPPVPIPLPDPEPGGESPAAATAEPASDTAASRSAQPEKQRRRRKAPRSGRAAPPIASPPPEAAPVKPTIDLKRGDVLNTF